MRERGCLDRGPALTAWEDGGNAVLQVGSPLPTPQATQKRDRTAFVPSLPFPEGAVCWGSVARGGSRRGSLRGGCSDRRCDQRRGRPPVADHLLSCGGRAEALCAGCVAGRGTTPRRTAARRFATGTGPTTRTGTTGFGSLCFPARRSIAKANSAGRRTFPASGAGAVVGRSEAAGVRKGQPPSSPGSHTCSLAKTWVSPWRASGRV